MNVDLVKERLSKEVKKSTGGKNELVILSGKPGVLSLSDSVPPFNTDVRSHLTPTTTICGQYK